MKLTGYIAKNKKERTLVMQNLDTEKRFVNGEHILPGMTYEQRENETVIHDDPTQIVVGYKWQSKRR